MGGEHPLPYPSPAYFDFALRHAPDNILTITHTQTHAHTYAHASVHTTRTCACHHRKTLTDKPINKLANKILSLLFLACPSIRCRGHSNLVIFIGVFSKFHIWIASIKLSFKFEYIFWSKDKQDGRENGRLDRSL